MIEDCHQYTNRHDSILRRGRRGRDRIVVGYTNIYAISADMH